MKIAERVAEALKQDFRNTIEDAAGIPFEATNVRMPSDEHWLRVAGAATAVMGELVTRSAAVVDLLEDAEINHGGLYSTHTLRAKNELRLELARWR